DDRGRLPAPAPAAGAVRVPGRLLEQQARHAARAAPARAELRGRERLRRRRAGPRAPAHRQPRPGEPRLAQPAPDARVAGTHAPHRRGDLRHGVRLLGAHARRAAADPLSVPPGVPKKILGDGRPRLRTFRAWRSPLPTALPTPTATPSRPASW